MFVCLFLSVCLTVFLSVCLTVYVCWFVSFFLSLSLSLSLYFSVNIYIYIYICVRVCVCPSLCICLSVCHSLSLTFSLSLYIYIYIYIWGNFQTAAITGRSLKVASNRLKTAAQYASSWIWSKARSFQHEGNTRGATFPCDYVRNTYCKHVITSTAESKRVFFKSQTAH